MRLTIAAAICVLSAQGQTLEPLAGPFPRGDGGPATEALVDGPAVLHATPGGDVYFTELHTAVIRRVRSGDGVVERVAGTGVRADGAEGRLAVETELSTPSALWLDSRTGELLFADSSACRIRKILTDGKVRNVVGTGRCAGTAGGGFPFPGLGGGSTRERLALDTDIGAVSALAIDGEGRLVFAEEDPHQLRRVDRDGIVRVIAGAGRSGFAGDGAEATNALLNSPTGLAVDAAGVLYVADSRNCRLRRINPDGLIDTVAGNGTCASRSASFGGGVATRASIGRLAGIAYDAGSHAVYAASPQQSRLLRVDLRAGRVSSALGNGTLGKADLSQTADRFALNEPLGVAVLAGGSVLVSAATAFQIYQLTPPRVAAFAGRLPGSTTLLRPVSSCAAPDGTLLILDAGTERIVRRDPASGEYGIFAGGESGPALSSPRRIFCAPSGEVYLSHDSFIRVIRSDRSMAVVKENLGEPVGLAFDPEGRLIYADASTHRVVRYDPATGNDTVLAGKGIAGFGGDGGAATDATLNSPGDLAFEASGNLLIADRRNRRVRRWRSGDGRIETVAGSSREFSYADISGERADDVGLGPIRALAVGTDGEVFVGDSARLLLLDSAGRVTLLAGYAGEDDTGLRSYRVRPLDALDGLAVGTDGWLHLVVGAEGVVLGMQPRR